MVWMSRQGTIHWSTPCASGASGENYFPVLMSMNEIVKTAFDRVGISIRSRSSTFI